MVMPSAMQSSSTSRPARVQGSFTAMFGAHWLKRLAIASIAGRLPARAGLTWAQT